MQEIQIIQGDSCRKKITVENVETLCISQILFTCKDLNISKELSYDETIDKFVLYFSSKETAELPSGVTDCDLTVRFIDTQIKTAMYKGLFVILEKTNKTNFEPSNEYIDDSLYVDDDLSVKIDDEIVIDGIENVRLDLTGYPEVKHTDKNARLNTLLYAYTAGRPARLTLQQIKDMSTKVVVVNNEDEALKQNLDVGDFVYIQKE